MAPKSWPLTNELCPKGPVLLKAIRICLRVRLRLAYATTILAYARDFVEFALTRSLRLQVFAPHHSASLRAAIFTSRMPWSWNLRQASDAVEVDEDEEVDEEEESVVSFRKTRSWRRFLTDPLLSARACADNFSSSDRLGSGMLLLLFFLACKLASEFCYITCLRANRFPSTRLVIVPTAPNFILEGRHKVSNGPATQDLRGRHVTEHIVPNGNARRRIHSGLCREAVRAGYLEARALESVAR